MTITKDRDPGTRYEEALIFLDCETDPTEDYLIQRNGEALRYKDGSAVRTILDSERHRIERQLTHDTIDESKWTEITRTDNKVTNVTVWNQESLPHTKIRETQITRTTGKVSQIVKIQYNTAGTVIERLTSNVARTSGKVSGITDTRATS
jgi:hypothetical protein